MRKGVNELLIHLKIYNYINRYINNMNSFQTEFMLKKTRKSIRKIIVYNIGNAVVVYVVYSCKNVLNKSNKISPDNCNQPENFHTVTNIVL